MHMEWKSEYESIEMDTHREIRRALDTAQNRRKVKDKKGRVVYSDYELAAVSLRGRLQWVKALFEELNCAFDAGDDAWDYPIFWFCLADTKCLERTHKYGPAITPKKCIKRYRHGLSGLNYMAMLEPAIYTSFSRKRPSTLTHLYPFEKVVSWHCHGIAWGPSRQELRRHFNSLEDDKIYTPIAPGLKGCWAQYIQPNKVGDKVAYMCKTPRLVNRLYLSNPDELEDDEWRFTQKEAKARPGEHVFYFKLLSDVTLDQLAFGGGEGSKVLSKVKAPFQARVRS